MERDNGYQGYLEEHPNVRKVVVPVVFTFKLLAWLLVVLVLALLSLYEFRSWFQVTNPVSIPVFFTFENMPPFEQIVGQPLRNSVFLQANFSLMGRRQNIEQLLVPVEYQIDINLIVPDYDVNYNEGMFLTCLRLFDKKDTLSWPIPGQEAEGVVNQYGRCRSSILIKQSFAKEIYERILHLPWYLWSTQNWPQSKEIRTSIEENYEIDVKRKPVKGVITVLSYNLQVAKSSITFSPKSSKLTKYPILSASVIFGFFFTFWFTILFFVNL